MTAVRGRRQEQKSRTRLQIQTAAIELYELHGYDDTNIEDIVARAGVAQRTFFRYFPSKELTLFSDDGAQQLIDLILGAPSHLSDLEALRWTMHRILEVEATPLDRRRQAIRQELKDRPAVQRQMSHLEEAMRAQLHSALARRLRDHAGGTERSENEIELSAEILASLYVGLGRAMRTREGPRAKVVDQWFALLGELSLPPGDD